MTLQSGDNSMLNPLRYKASNKSENPFKIFQMHRGRVNHHGDLAVFSDSNTTNGIRTGQHLFGHSPNSLQHLNSPYKQNPHTPPSLLKIDF